MPNARIKTIQQRDNCSFSILWNDEKTSVFRLADLQRACPCAGCVDEITGRRRILAEDVPEALEAISIESVGRYALKIHFRSGCSRGIYHFNYLRQLGGIE